MRLRAANDKARSLARAPLRGLFSIFYQVTSEHGKSRLERGTHRGLGLDFSLCYFDLAERFAFLQHHADFSDEFKGRRKMN
jgi:hypothetical protein